MVLFVPGGAYVGGAKSRPGVPLYRNVGVFFARNGVVAVTMNYRLAPKDKWPARRKLIDKAGEVADFLTSLALLPMRPGNVAKLRVENLDVRHRVLKVPDGKTKTRMVPLAGDALIHFKTCAKQTSVCLAGGAGKRRSVGPILVARPDQRGG